MYPIIFSESGFMLTSLGIFSVLALVSFVILLCRFSAIKGRDIQFIYDHFLILLLCFLVGARFQIVIENWTYFSTNFSEIFYAFWVGGFGLFGGLIGFILALFHICLKKKESFLIWLDIFSSALLPSLMLIYIGQFLDGSNYGTPTGLPWGVNYENPTVPYSIAVHPTQIYLFLTCLASFLLGKYLMKRRARNGVAGFFSLLLMSGLTFLIYFLNGEISMHIFGLRSAQVFVIMFTVIVAILYFNAKNSKIIR